MVFPEALVPIKIYIARVPPTLPAYSMVMTDKWDPDQDCTEIIILGKKLKLFRVKNNLLKTVHIYNCNKS